MRELNHLQVWYLIDVQRLFFQVSFNKYANMDTKVMSSLKICVV